MSYELIDDEKPWAKYLNSYTDEAAEALDRLNHVLYDADERLEYDEMMEKAGYNPDNLPKVVRWAGSAVVTENFASANAQWEFKSLFE